MEKPHIDREIDDAIFQLFDVIRVHRGLSDEVARARLKVALWNMNGEYAVLGRLPDEIVGWTAEGGHQLKDLDEPPRFDARGFAAKP